MIKGTIPVRAPTSQTRGNKGKDVGFHFPAQIGKSARIVDITSAGVFMIKIQRQERAWTTRTTTFVQTVS